MEQQITRKPDNAFKKLTQFFIVDKVFLVSFIIAVISVSMGGIQTEFFDNKVIVTVFGLMLVIAGFRSTGILSYMGQTLVKRSKTTRQLVRFTTMLAFFFAVFFRKSFTLQFSFLHYFSSPLFVVIISIKSSFVIPRLAASVSIPFI